MSRQSAYPIGLAGQPVRDPGQIGAAIAG